MDWKKPLTFSIVAYALLYLLASLFMQWVPTTDMMFGVLMWIFTIIVVFVLGNYYYFKTKPSDPIKEGLIWGIFLVVISIIIEIPLMVYGFAAEAGWAYFGNWTLWIGWILLLIMPIVVAKMKK